jgi:hypothetical protein
VIYQVTIPNFANLRDEFIEKVRDTASAICKWNYGRSPTHVLELVSERINKLDLDKITEALVRAEIQYTVEDFEAEYLHVATRAPESYDYAGTCISLGFSLEGEFGPERHVAVRKDRQEYQFGRYASGLHAYRVIS